MGLLHRLLAHPLTRGMDLDDPRTTALRRQIIQSKPGLRRIYEEWYRLLADAVPPATGNLAGAGVLELGSGAGFLKQFIPGLITSEVFSCPGINLVCDGQRLPLADGSLRAIVMSDVLHHVPDPRMFFSEATRVIRPGGVVAMTEPWNTAWARWVYQHLHHEPFVPDAPDWKLDGTGPLSSSNQAMPWMMFVRDRARFESEFPQWRIGPVRTLIPLRYILSGGVSLRNLMPGPVEWLVRGTEACMPGQGMFGFVTLTRIG